MLVWKAMLSITLMISAMLRPLSSMARMVCDHLAHHSRRP
jgi:hypothetical protein